MKVRAAFFLGSLLVCVALPPLPAHAEIAHAKIALFGLANRQGDHVVSAAAQTVADTIELSLWLLGCYDVDRLPPADPSSDMARIQEYCRVNRVDQAICGSAQAKGKGGFSLRMAVYDRRLDGVSLVRDGTAASALEIFDVADTLVSSLLDALNGAHVELGVLEVQSDPVDAAVFLNGREVGRTPVTLRSVPAGLVQVVARADGREETAASAEVTDGGVARAALTLARSTGAVELEVPLDAALSVQDAEGVVRQMVGPGVVPGLPTGRCEVRAQCVGLETARALITVERNVTVLCMPWPKGYLAVESDPPGATVLLDGVKSGITPMVAEVDPEKKYRLLISLANHAEAVVEADAAAGRKQTVYTTLVPFPGSISVETNFPGTRVTLDQERTLETPCVFEDVPPGEHRISFFPILVSRRIYEARDAMTVNVAPGERAAISTILTESYGMLSITDAPSGSTAMVDGTRVDSDAVFSTGIELRAGILDVEVESPHGQRWTETISLVSGNSVARNAGVMTLSTAQMTLSIPRRTIRIDGSIEDWAGVEPMMHKQPYFALDLCPNQPGTVISRGFVCRDERFLYIRFDFEDGNLSEKLSKDIPYSLDYGARIFFSPFEDIRIGIRTERTFWGSRQARYFGIDKSGAFRDLGTGLDAKAGDATLEVAVPIAPILRYTRDQALGMRLFVALARPNGNWQERVESTTQVINFAN